MVKSRRDHPHAPICVSLSLIWEVIRDTKGRIRLLGTKWKLLEQLLKVNKFINGISIYNPWKLSPSIV